MHRSTRLLSLIAPEPDPGLEWICYLAVAKKIMTREICLCVAADLDEVVDVLSFAQAVMDTGLCKDLHLVQNLTDEALEQWAQGKEPPFSVFAEEPPGAGSEPAPGQASPPPGASDS